MTQGNDFAFNDTATRLRSADETGIKADSPPLTKREYYAGIAMQGLLANANTGAPHDFNRLASDSVSAADAIITALNANK